MRIVRSMIGLLQHDRDMKKATSHVHTFALKLNAFDAQLLRDLVARRDETISSALRRIIVPALRRQEKKLR